MRIFEELTGQVKRRFSSKNNAAKLVPRLTDQLHYYNQILLAISVALLLGYSNFRAHFDCQSIGKLIDKKTATLHCWTNGTTTLDTLDDWRDLFSFSLTNDFANYPNSADSSNVDRSIQSSPAQASIRRDLPTHVGHGFNYEKKTEQIVHHNYMRSTWLVLLIMICCSYYAQRHYASLLGSDTLKALLKLPGSDKLDLVAVAQKERPLDKLMQFRSNQSNGRHDNQQHEYSFGGGQKSAYPAEIFSVIELFTGEQNYHNRHLDYYANQLIYLLLAKRTAAYKLSDLKVKRGLIRQAFVSLTLTCAQFVIPLISFGPAYLLFGLRIAKAWIEYLCKYLLTTNISVPINSVDYAISSSIFPISAQCSYQHHGFVGLELRSVQCTMPISEVSSKVFAVIWWVTVLNILVEMYSCLWLLLVSCNFRWTAWYFGHKYWPRMAREAELISNFRYEHLRLFRKSVGFRPLATSPPPDSGSDHHRGHQDERIKSTTVSNEPRDPSNNDDDDDDRLSTSAAAARKRLEAIGADQQGSSEIPQFNSKKWYLWCSRDVALFLACKSKQLTSGKRKSNRDDDGFYEVRENSDVLFLLYLLYLRLNRSSKKVERVIKMTNDALQVYLASLCQLQAGLKRGLLPVVDQQPTGEGSSSSRSSATMHTALSSLTTVNKMDTTK